MKSRYFVIGNYDDLYRLDNGTIWNHYNEGWQKDCLGPWVFVDLASVKRHCEQMNFQFREIESDDIFLELI